MAVLIDPPRWPAHGTTWSHVVSDTSLLELAVFAQRVGLPARSFDLDHYDVPAHRHGEMVAAGAEPVTGAELVRRLRSSGIRVRAADRPAERRRRLDLRGRWVDLGVPAAVGEELLHRWCEPHRRYHDSSHLQAVLEHLDTLADAGEAVTREVRLAAWFHDAVHAGEAGEDERRSAALVEDLGPRAGLSEPEIAEVRRLVLLTTDHSPAPADRAGAALSDADLAVLGGPRSRYAQYAAAVRAEYAHVAPSDFARGRAAVLRALLDRPELFRTAYGRRTWEAAARQNLRAELGALEA